MTPSLSFQGGTLVLYDLDQHAAVHPAFQWVKARWRCEAYHYPALSTWLQAHAIRDNVPRWRPLDLPLQDRREPHDYQVEALGAWDAAGRLGSIVLPTGAGKTFVALQAIHRVNRSAVVVAPTIDLLHQWYARLSNAFATEIGVYYGGEKQVQPITVTTYHSAGDLIAEAGNLFKLIIYDEVHHLPAPSWGETALMSPALHRLGLTATYPEAHEQENGRWRVADLIGPIVYEKQLGELVGKQLAEYRTERIRVDLTAAERRLYDADYAVYAAFWKERQLPRTHGPKWYRELMRLSTFDPAARRALLARQRLQRLLAGAEEKLAVLDKLLREYRQERVLIFTENNAVAYDISRRHLIPAVTHETKAAERKQILEGFQAGTYRALVTAKVLNEGVDVPEAKVAIVLGARPGRASTFSGWAACCARPAIARPCSSSSPCAIPSTRTGHGGATGHGTCPGASSMLTGDLVRPRLHKYEGELRVKLLDGTNRRAQDTAAALIALFQQQVGRTYGAWEEALAHYEGDRTDYVVIRGLAKVLTDAATYVACETPVAPAEVRAALFARGPAFGNADLLHPRTRADLLAEAAGALGLQPEQVEAFLYADRRCNYVLADAGPAWTPADLIARYNLELSRAALYWSDGLQVTIQDTFKDFWRYLKLFKLMFWATPSGDGYNIALDGPISPFVKSTTRYGRQLAAFLPALLLCDQWQMEATVHPPQLEQGLVYRLDNTAPLTTHFRRSGAFDSRLEADFAAEFEGKFGGKRGQWQLTREDELLLLGDTVMIPDFALTHKRDGRRALVEIVGYWHPEYLRRKVAKVRAAQRQDLILLVYQGANLAREKLQDVPGEVLYFQKKPVLKDVMAAVERAAV